MLKSQLTDLGLKGYLLVTGMKKKKGRGEREMALWTIRLKILCAIGEQCASKI